VCAKIPHASMLASLKINVSREVSEGLFGSDLIGRVNASAG
jgi:hypothetical protein